MEKIARSSGVPLDECPTCHAKPTEVISGVYGWENGTYILDGVEHPCDCEEQKRLRKHYLLAGIGDQYMRLNWDEDFDGDEETKDMVALYLKKRESFRQHGMGMEFSSPSRGVGKTFAATHIAKELIKDGHKVKFIHFMDLVTAFEEENADEIKKELRSVNYLILDEVLATVSRAQWNVFAPKFEDVIRHRTNFNLPTIMTTNLTEEELEKEYPRTYSLLAAKQMRVVMHGDDQRKAAIALDNLTLALNDEVRPIS